MLAKPTNRKAGIPQLLQELLKRQYPIRVLYTAGHWLDINSLDDAERALHESGADGVMIGRGAYGRPWFVGQVIEWLRTRRRLPDPPLANQYATLRAHYDAMLSHYGNDVGVKIARKHIGWYSKGLPGSAEFRAAVNQTVEPDAVRRLIRAYYEPLVEREAA